MKMPLAVGSRAGVQCLLRLQRSQQLLARACISTALPLRAARRSSETKYTTPEERLTRLRSAEKRVALFAGASLLIGYFALKKTFSDMAAKRPQKTDHDVNDSSQTMPTLPRPLVMAGPSGAGKSTLIKQLFKEHPEQFGFSVSHTTRKPRPGEVDGREYHFTTREAMKKSIADGNFIEWAEFSGNMYGTSKKAVEDVQKTGKCCVLDIDMQGVRSIKATSLPAVYVLVRPPSMAVLEQRLRDRGTETEESLRRRLDTATKELEFASTPGVFDHMVVNETLDSTYHQLRDIILKELKL